VPMSLPARRSAHVAAFAVALAACSGLQPTPAAEESRLGERATRALSPDELRLEAYRVDRGVIPGTGEAGEATLVPLVAPPGRHVLLPAWWVEGEAAPITVSAFPPSRGLRVLTLREGGELAKLPAPALRAAAWSGVAAASRAVGAEMGKLGFAVSGAGADHPAAEAALAAAFAAAAVGLEIRPDVIALGSVALDGGLLPVAGIAQLAAATRARGASEVGVPPGSGAPDATRVVDVAAAIELLTGERLPEPRAVDQRAMSPSEADALATREAYRAVRRTLAGHWSRVVVLDNQAPLPEPLAELVQRAQRDARLAEEAYARDQLAVAYTYIRSAAIAAASADHAWSLVEAIREQQLDAARRLFRGYRPLRDRAGELASLGFEDTPPLSAAMRRLEIQSAALRADAMAAEATRAARAALAYAEEAAALSDADRRGRLVTEGAVLAALPATVSAARAADELGYAAALLEFPDPPSPPLRARAEQLDRLAGYLATAGAARLDSAARDANPSAPSAVHARHARQAAFGGASPLAAAFVLYTEGSMLAAEGGSLEIARRAGSQLALTTGAPELFDTLLEGAEGRARVHARAALAAGGYIPVSAKLAYAEASALASGDATDRVRALFALWRSSALSQLAVSLALR
jgi:hypothetical protein